MRGKWVSLGLIISFGLIGGLAAGVAKAQTPQPATVDLTAMNCSGEVTSAPVSRDSYVISGEKSITKIVFGDHDLVYINRGADKGVNVGDRFRVIRPVKDEVKEPWFKGQMELVRALGQNWADLGTIKVLHVGPKVSTAEVTSTCAYMQRGDVILPFVERPPLPLKPNAHLVDAFAPTAGKTGMVVTTKMMGEVAGTNDIIYVNLGSAQGLQVGGYVRVFRHQGNEGGLNYQDKGTEYKMYGFGSAPEIYTWEGLPREILGEGIVLRVSANSATVMITAMRREIYVGDYVEIE
jgi:hypothetical protein